MTDKQEPNDEICSMSKKFEAITTTDKNSHDRAGGNSSLIISSIQQEMRQDSEEFFLSRGAKKDIPERIIFVVDTIRENDCTPFEIGSGAKFLPLEMIKRVVEIFICAKGTISRKHEYAIVELTGDIVHWLCDFTDNPKSLINHLDRVEDVALEENSRGCDLTECFQLIVKKIDLEWSSREPNSLTRVILIYSRSHCVPGFSDPTSFRTLMENPHFFTDVVYVHEPVTDENECEEIYTKLGELDVKQNSYIFEVGRNAAALHNTMAKLLAHPLQRPKQDDTSYVPQYLETHDIQTNV
ncbi:BRISC and BRCA1-A complex member 1 [Fopius arisanus]|uniref:BABAM1_0 protein n=1 Tax=Fopius arisanus TaxID=64838 RepID=A0A0C9RUJ1_9HYME|nr:PREDICTED: BRISC and BRCA1-A complex member 1-like [Fopius arisanus]XP_011300949.1 PREDICTED: BRISC and BRCA1-A complex member 1-like [Fopius arisanus]